MDPDSALQVPKSGDNPIPGSLVAEKYRILRTVGEGGMGIVVEAQHIQLEQRVAIKFLRGAQAEDDRNVMRFRREARAAAKVKSDHVAQVYDVGILEDGTRYLVMEYLDGCDLAEEMERSGRFPVGQACSVAVQVLDAICHAHEVGIVHRDLKPENIFLVRQPDGTRRVKVVDFGISKLDDTQGSLKLTGTSDLMGTPLYMAPEQMATPELVDGRADIWSIGCVLYEMLSGEVPFDGKSIPEICMLVLGQDPRPLDDVVPDVPRELGEAVMKCLRREPDERISSAAELSDLLMPYVVGSSAPTRSWMPGRITGVMKVTDVDAHSLPPHSHARSFRDGQGLSQATISGIPSRTLSADTSGLRDLMQDDLMQHDPKQGDMVRTTGDVSFRPRRRWLPWVAGVLFLVAGFLGAAAFGVLPAPLNEVFVEPADGALEVPAVGAAQSPHSTSDLREKAEAQDRLEQEAATPSTADEPPAEATPSAPVAGWSSGNTNNSASRNLRPKTVATSDSGSDASGSTRPGEPRKSAEPHKKSVAAPYEEFADFGGRR